jgi:hypothetical protein
MAIFSPKEQKKTKTWRDYLAAIDLSPTSSGQVNMFELGKALGLTGGGMFGAFPEEKTTGYDAAAFTDAYFKEYGKPSTAEEHYNFAMASDNMGFDDLSGYHYKKSFEAGGGDGKPKTSSIATLSETAGNIEQILGSMETRAQEEDWFGFSSDEFRKEDRPVIEGAVNILTQTPGLSPVEQQTLLQSAVGRTGGLFGTGLFEDLKFDYDTFLKNYNTFIQEKGLTKKQEPQQTQPQQVPQGYNPFRR